MKAPKNPKQLALFSTPTCLGSLEHGGELNLGKRKKARPFSPDAPIHVVLKSHRAHGPWSLLHPRNRARVEALIGEQAKRAGVKVYRQVNVGSHLHLVIRAFTRQGYRSFLRSISGLIARHVMGSSASAAASTKGKRASPDATPSPFWQSIPYTRLLHWGREFRLLCAYLAKNTLEAWGFSGARLRFTPKGQAVLVVGAPEFRPGRGMDWHNCMSLKQDKSSDRMEVRLRDG